jgi:hypothetical protein
MGGICLAHEVSTLEDLFAGQKIEISLLKGKLEGAEHELTEVRGLWAETESKEIEELKAWGKELERGNAHLIEKGHMATYAAKTRVEHAKKLEAEVKTLSDKLKEEEDLHKVSFTAGWEKGVRDFAIWRDGEQLVGCRQRPLKEILEQGPLDGV